MHHFNKGSFISRSQERTGGSLLLFAVLAGCGPVSESVSKFATAPAISANQSAETQNQTIVYHQPILDERADTTATPPSNLVNGMQFDADQLAAFKKTAAIELVIPHVASPAYAVALLTFGAIDAKTALSAPANLILSLTRGKSDHWTLKFAEATPASVISEFLPKLQTLQVFITLNQTSAQAND